MKLSVIIPFKNEGHRLVHTLRSVRYRYREDEVEIIAINDASTDDFDYSALEKDYGCKMYTHKGSYGVAESRSVGIDYCTSDNILLLDAHMTMPNEYDWVERIVTHIKANKRAMYFTNNIFLNDFGIKIQHAGNVNGAYIKFGDGEGHGLECKWASYEKKPRTMPCLLGAGYAFDKEYFKRLGRLHGLKSYGADEQFLSIKCWLEGGEVVIMDDVSTGHWYRSKHPYKVSHNNSIYNKLFIIETCCLDEEQRNAELQKLLSTDSAGNKSTTYSCQEMYDQNKDYMKMWRKHFKSIFIHDFSYFKELNDRFYEEYVVPTSCHKNQ